MAKTAKPSWKSPLRLDLTGRVMAERDGRVVDEKRLPGRQGPVALVYLALERARPVPIDELADAVWGESLPRAWVREPRGGVARVRGVSRAAREGAGRRAVAGDRGVVKGLRAR